MKHAGRKNPINKNSQGEAGAEVDDKDVNDQTRSLRGNM